MRLLLGHILLHRSLVLFVKCLFCLLGELVCLLGELVCLLGLVWLRCEWIALLC